MKKILYSAASLTVLFFSCKPKMDIPAAGKGSLNLTTYVAIGSSMTAGYADNALYRDAQLVSYPNLIAGQFKLAGGGEFKQPLFNANSVGFGAAGNAKFILGPVNDCAGMVSLAPTPVAQQGDIAALESIGDQGPFNNVAVPGLKVSAALAGGYGDYNLFYGRIASASNSSVIGDAVSQQPTFFSVSLGNDDVMSYALAGGNGGSNDNITDPADFNTAIDAMLNLLTVNQAKGVVANIPQIATLPFFTTVPYNGLALDASMAAGLSAAYAQAGITFHEGNNAFVIADADAPAGFRQINAGEYILLTIPQDEMKCNGMGSVTPIPEQYVLKASEVALVNEATDAYNSKLHDAAIEKGLAFVDVDAFMKKVNTGIIYNGVAVRAQYITGGAFSLDGVHLTPLGNALLANEFIKSINARYGSTIPQVNATKYKGVSFP